MQFDEFVTRVADRTGLERESAGRTVQATLTTLAERIVEGEALDLAAQLPRDLQPAVRAADEHGEHFSLEEFGERVAGRAGISPEEGQDAARAVLITLRDAVSAGEIDDVLGQLPADLRELFEPT